MSEDVDIKVDAHKGKASAKVTSPGAGSALKVTAYGGVIFIALGVIAVCVGLGLGYDQVSFGPLRFSKAPSEKSESAASPSNGKIRNVQSGPKKEEQAANPVKPIEVRPEENAFARMTDKTVQNEQKKIGPPLNILPHLVENGIVWLIVPLLQGDEDADSEKLPKGAFKEHGRWFIKVPFKCQTLEGLPMPNEACAASLNSPNGRPILRQ